MGLANFIRDRLANVMSGQGTTIDRRTSASYVFNAITPEQSEAAYRTSWLPKKIVDIPAKDMTREWRDWQAENPQIEKLEAEEKRLRVRDKVRAALIASRIYGGAAIILGTGDSNYELPLDVERIKVGGLRWLRVMSMQQLSIGPQRLDPEDEFIDQPEYFEMQASMGKRVRVHPSRVLEFIGQRPPEGAYHRSTNGGWYWGDPVLQSIGDAVKNADLAQNGFAALIDEAKLDILKMPGLTDLSSTDEGEQKIVNRLAATAIGKSTWRALLLDAEDEWQQRQITWSGIPDTMMTFLNVVAGAADIPVTRLLGQSPKGLQSTGDGEERDYHAMVKANQDEQLAPVLDRLDEVLIRSALGSRPKEIYYLFAPLSELSEKEASDIEKQTADTLKVYGDTGLIHEEALAEIARNKMIEGGRWPGCEAAFESVDNALAEGPTPEEEKLQLQAANENTVQKMQAKGAVNQRQADALLTDARPRSLYVQRKLLNAADFLKWAKGAGFDSTVPADELHVTVLYSRQPVDWLKMGGDSWNSDDKGQLRVPPGGARIVEPLGDKGAIVLLFNSSSLSWRHEEMIRNGASHDFDEYQPHVTITYAGSDVDLEGLEPYRGELLFGPEIFEEVDDGWSANLVETGSKKKTELGDFNPNHVAHGEHGGEFTSGNVRKLTPALKREQLVKPNEGKSLDQIRHEAIMNQGALRAIGQDLTAEGIDFREPPPGFEVKTRESLERKIRDEGYSGAHEITDVSRATVVVKSPEEGDRTVKALAARGTVFDRGWQQIEKTGYLDRKVYLQHPNGGISEIQIVPAGVQQLKEGEGHKLYEVMRLPSNPIDTREAAAERSRALYAEALKGTAFKQGRP
jgi:phage-related protein (TIGR01555 family)